MSLKLFFFPFAGRALPARLAFVIGNVPFVDERVPFDKWDSSDKDSFPAGSLPVLHITDDITGATTLVLSESQAIYRYAGHRAGLYPSGPTEIGRVEEVLKLVEDVFSSTDPIGLMRTFHLQGDALFSARKEFVAKTIPTFISRIEKLLVGPYTTGSTISISDVTLFCIVRLLMSGNLDHVPVDVLEAYPRCRGVCEGVFARPEVMAYFAKYPNEVNGA